jgi:hypothetical protein
MHSGSFKLRILWSSPKELVKTDVLDPLTASMGIPAAFKSDRATNPDASTSYHHHSLPRND